MEEVYLKITDQIEMSQRNLNYYLNITCLISDLKRRYQVIPKRDLPI